jgi:NADH dehydrogenase FAD-containing subunit
MVFTPLLASTTTGTLEFRSIAEPVRAYKRMPSEHRPASFASAELTLSCHAQITSIQPALYWPQNQYYTTATATNVDPAGKIVKCISDDSITFDVHYDKLAICTGSQARLEAHHLLQTPASALPACVLHKNKKGSHQIIQSKASVSTRNRLSGGGREAHSACLA